MLRNVNQTSEGLLPVIKKYGCLFMCHAYASPILFQGDDGVRKLNALWKKAVELGIISDDLNHDGDYDDNGEAEVLDHNALAEKIFANALKYDNIHHGADEELPDNAGLVIGMYKYKGTHFVVLDRNKKVMFDPLIVSATVRSGILYNMRWYLI